MLKRIVSSALGSLGYRLVKTTLQPHYERSRLSLRDREFVFISTLPGFLTRDAYDLFCRLAPYYSHRASVLELGIFCGRSFLGLGFAFANASRVIGIDPFYEDFKNSPAFEDEGAFLKQASHGLAKSDRIALLNQALRKGEEFRPGLSARLTVREMTQCSFLKTKKASETFDVVHVDGEHTFEAVDEFLRHADRVLNPNSLVIVDDFFNPGFPGISEAVHTNVIYKKELFPVVYGFNKAVFVYKPQADEVGGLSHLLAVNYKLDGRLVRRFSDGSILIQ